MRNTVKIPSPLLIEEAKMTNSQPESTTAKFEEYVKNRTRILQIPTSQLRKLSIFDREDQIYQYLTPDEIWMVEDAMKRTVPVGRIKVMTSVDDEKHSTVEDFILHQQKRREFKSLSDEELKCMTSAELEYYYQFLTTDELLAQNEKFAQLKL